MNLDCSFFFVPSLSTGGTSFFLIGSQYPATNTIFVDGIFSKFLFCSFNVPKIYKRVYIRKDGTTLLTRPIERIGAHVKGFNASSIGICYEGGLDCRGRPADTRTPEQKASLRLLVYQLKQRFSGCRVCGHRDLSPDLNGDGEIEPEEWIKACPCFEVNESL
ncbi:N-acetylmuramoyl-L-alanine amidase [Bacteroides thetaiotaomicron]